MPSFVHKVCPTTLFLLLFVRLVENSKINDDNSLSQTNSKYINENQLELKVIQPTLILDHFSIPNQTFSLQTPNEKIPNIEDIVDLVLRELVTNLDLDTTNLLAELLRYHDLDITDLVGDNQEKFFLTSNNLTTTMVSFWGSVYSALWVLVVGVVSSMIICYWVGCEYETTVSYRSLSQVSTYATYVHF